LKLVVPVTLLIIFALLYDLPPLGRSALIMGTLPFALTGGVWLLYLLGYNQSVATGVGFIALAGVSAEFGVVMLIYLKHALRIAEHSPEDVVAAVREGALLRVRPKAMTVAVILAGLFPDPARHRHRFRSDEPDRRADDRRDAHRAAALDAHHPRRLSADAPIPQPV
jgi:Cu(I)/Ag(I) efflux system membrane protein CusA/SilA